MTGLKLKPRFDLPNWISKSCKVKYQKFQDYRQIYETLFKWRFNQQSKGWLGIMAFQKRCNLLFHYVSLHTVVYLFQKPVIFLNIIIQRELFSKRWLWCLLKSKKILEIALYFLIWTKAIVHFLAIDGILDVFKDLVCTKVEFAM